MLAPMFRAVRRPLVAAGVVLLLAGCGPVGQPAPYDSTGIDELVIPTPSPDPDDFVDVVDNPWLAWEPGQRHGYPVMEAGRRIGRLVVRVSETPTDVDGVMATTVTEDLHRRGHEPRQRTGLYAQDTKGNVWQLAGEEGGDAWQAGRAGALAGLLMPAEPRSGDGWVSGEHDGAVTVLSVQGRSDLAGDGQEWSDALEVEWSPADDSNEARTERRWYASGVGLVRVEDLAAGYEATLPALPNSSE